MKWQASVTREPVAGMSVYFLGMASVGSGRMAGAFFDGDQSGSDALGVGLGACTGFTLP